MITLRKMITFRELSIFEKNFLSHFLHFGKMIGSGI